METLIIDYFMHIPYIYYREETSSLPDAYYLQLVMQVKQQHYQ